MELLDGVSQKSFLASGALEKIPAILRAMKYNGVDAEAISCSIVADQGDMFVVPEYRQSRNGWMPILDWSFVSFDPTR